MAISFGRAALAFTGGVARGIGEAEDEARKQKKLDERAYLDRYTQAAQNALRFAETDRQERNTKVDTHRKNLGLITAAIKGTGATDEQARQAAAQIYKQNRTAEGAQIAAKRIENALSSFENDPEARMEVYNGLKATFDPAASTSLDEFSQYLAGPSTSMKTYMPDMPFLDNRTKLQKLLGREVEESESVKQTRTMFESMGRKPTDVPSLTIPEGNITLPTEISDKSAQQLSDMYFNIASRFKDKDPVRYDAYMTKYNEQQDRIREEALNKKIKDAKAPLSVKEITNIAEEQMKQVEFMAGDVERYKMLSGEGALKEGDVAAVGSREAIFRMYKHAQSLPDSGDTRAYLKNIASAGRIVGISPPVDNATGKEIMSFEDMMSAYNETRLGTASLSTYRDIVLNGKKAYDAKDGTFTTLPATTQAAVLALYDPKTQERMGKTQDEVIQNIGEAFFLPMQGSGRTVIYDMKLKQLFGIGK